MTIGSDPHSKAADAVHEGRPVEAQYVRQGRRGTRVLLILVIALAGAILAVWGTWAVFFSKPLNTTEPHNARQVSDAVNFGDSKREALQTPAQDPTAAARGSTPDKQQLPTAAPQTVDPVQAQPSAAPSQ